MTRALIDTNVFISGTLWKGTPQKVLSLWSQSKFKLVVSSEIVAEYEKVFNDLLDHQPDLSARILETIRMHAEYVEPGKLPRQICRDPKDDMFIAAAISAKVDYVVSGDKDLLVLNGSLDLKILNPRQFLEAIGG